MMKFYQRYTGTIFIIFFSTYLDNSGAKTKYVVTKFKDLSQYYLQLREQNSNQLSSILSTRKKNSLCEEIFQIVETNPLVDLSIINAITFQSDHPALFNKLFKKQCPLRYRLLKKDCDLAKKTYHYITSSRPINLMINGDKYEENVFVCVFSTDNDNYHLYYVSDYAYNVKDSMFKSPLHGQFILYNDELFALAEKLPTIWVGPEDTKIKYFSLPNLFLNARRAYSVKQWTIADEKTDPVCGLDDGRKLRLCTSVIMIDSEVTPQLWQQGAISVRQKSCERRTLQFKYKKRYGNYINEWIYSKYNEWMLICDYYKSDKQIRSLLVSRAYMNHKVFVSVLNETNDVYLIYILNYIAVVTDGKNNKTQAEYDGKSNKTQTEYNGKSNKTQTEYDGKSNRAQTEYDGKSDKAQTKYDDKSNKAQAE